MSERKPVSFLTVNVQEKQGTFYAFSLDLPGLHVCASSEDTLRERVVSAVTAMLKHRKGIDINVLDVTDLDSFPGQSPIVLSKQRTFAITPEAA